MGVWIETKESGSYHTESNVTPYVGVWIETHAWTPFELACGVTPYVGVWIETQKIQGTLSSGVSHPTWVCGLKQSIGVDKYPE